MRIYTHGIVDYHAHARMATTQAHTRKTHPNSYMGNEMLVSTIHSFSLLLIRTFFREAGFSKRPSVMAPGRERRALFEEAWGFWKVLKRH